MATDDNKDFGFSENQRARFLEHGYLRLGHVLTETELSALQQRIDEIMMGQVCYQHMRMQLLDPESGQGPGIPDRGSALAGRRKGGSSIGGGIVP